MRKSLIAASLCLTASLAQADTISCVLENNRVMTLGNLGSSPVYSYGPAGKIELTLPTGAANSGVYKGSEMFSGGGSAYLAFTNGNYTYAAYTGIGRGWEFTGLKVYKGSEIIMERQCKDTDALLGLDPDRINAPEGELPY